MPYQIKSFISGFPNEKIVHHETADSYEDAKVLLDKFKDEEIQRNNEVSEIEDNFFSSIDSITEQEKIFEISEV
jgi:hypothetical protein